MIKMNISSAVTNAYQHNCVLNEAFGTEIVRCCKISRQIFIFSSTNH